MIALCLPAAKAALAQAPPAIRVAQPPGLTAHDLAHGSLPTNNEVELLLPQLLDAIAKEDADNSIRLLDAIKPFANELSAADGGLYYRPVHEVVATALAKSSPRIVSIYRQLHDPAIEVEFEQLRGSGDLSRLAELFTEHPLSVYWPAIGAELVEQYLELGLYAEAFGVADRLDRTLPRGTEQLRLQRVAALGKLGALSKAAAEMSSLSGGETSAIFDDWLAQLLEAHVMAQPSGRIELLPAQPWVSGLPRGSLREIEPVDRLAERLNRQGHHLQLRPVVGADRIVLRRGSQLLAFDRQTLLPAWDAAFEAEIQTQYRQNVRRQLRRQIRQGMDARKDFLVMDGWQGAVSCDDEHVYVLESFFGVRVPQRNRSGAVSGAYSVAARRLSDGRKVWRILSRDFEQATYFLTAPVRVGESLAIVFQRGADIGLALMDRATGKTLAEEIIIGPPHFPSARGGQYFLVAAGNDVYVVTGNGVIAGLTVSDHSSGNATPELNWRWAAVYASELVSPVVRSFIGRDMSRVYPAEPPILFEDLLVVSPIDADLLIAVDRITGRKRWETPRKQDEHLVGVASIGVVVSGERVRCLSLEDGRTELWQAAPLPLSGLPELIGERIYVPTLDGLCVLDANNGRIIADQWLPESDPTEASPPLGVVAADGDDLLLLTAERLYRFAEKDFAIEQDPNQTKWSTEDDAAALYARACRAAATNQLVHAFNLLSALAGSETSISEEAQQMRVQIGMRLAEANPAERIQWLESVAQKESGHFASSELSLALAHAYAEQDRFADAFRAAKHVMVQGQGALLADEIDGLKVADWIRAAGMIRKIWGAIPSEEIANQASELSAAAIATDEPMRLMRLIEVLPDQVDAAAVRQALTTWGTRPLKDFGRVPLRPEQLFGYLGADDEGLSGESRWRLALRRLDTNVSLARRNAAEAEITLLDELQEQSLYTPSRADERARRRAETALSELIADQAVPEISPDVVRQWRLGGMRLAAGRGRSLLPRSLIGLRAEVDDPNALVTFRPVRGDWRERTRAYIPQGLATGEFDIGSARLNLESLIGETRYADHVAIIPVTDGIIGIGTANYHQGGKRLWSNPRADLSAALLRGLTATTKRVLAVATDQNELVGIDLLDGSVRWSRRLELPVHGVHATNSKIVLFHRSEPPRFFAADDGTVILHEHLLPNLVQVQATPNEVLLWADESMMVLDDEALALRHRVACPTPARIMQVHGAAWLALQDFNGRWQIRDTSTAERISISGFETAGNIEGIAVEGERLIFARESLNIGGRGTALQITSLGLTSEVPGWTCLIDGVMELHPSSLAASANWIPIFRLSRSKASNERVPNIVFVEKQTGVVVDLNAATQSLLISDPAFQNEVMPAQMYVTPSRLIIQARDSLIGFGAGISNP